MKLALAFLAALALGSTLLHAEPARCGSCFETICYSNAACPNGCFCMKLGDGAGTCTGG